MLEKGRSKSVFVGSNFPVIDFADFRDLPSQKSTSCHGQETAKDSVLHLVLVLLKGYTSPDVPFYDVVWYVRFCLQTSAKSFSPLNLLLQRSRDPCMHSCLFTQMCRVSAFSTCPSVCDVSTGVICSCRFFCFIVTDDLPRLQPWMIITLISLINIRTR